MATSSNTVLIVEDDFVIALGLAAALSDAGWRVLGPALTTRHALQLLDTERPSVAVLDVTLDDEFVTVVAVALTSLNVPFVFASAYEDVTNVIGAIATGVLNVGKPTDYAQLSLVLASLVAVD